MTKKSTELSANEPNSTEICSFSFEKIKEILTGLSTKKSVNLEELCNLCNINPTILDKQNRGKLLLLQTAYELLMAVFEYIENTSEETDQ